MKSTATTTVIILVIALALVGVLSSAYIVRETEQVIITEFGEPVGEAIAAAGLHWRKPFIQKVNRFDKRILSFDGEPNQIPTKDKKYIYIDTFARWRIQDPLKFFKAVHDEIGAQGRLDSIIDPAARDAISDNPLLEAVRNTNRELTFETSEDSGDQSMPQPPGGDVASVAVQPQANGASAALLEINLPPVVKGRSAITTEMLQNAQVKVGEYGIELLDVRIKRINYVKEVRNQVYTRMISERDQIAEKYRSEGEQFNLGFSGKIEREKARLLSEAYAKSEAIKAQGDAQAARIYADAYNKDPEFYLFWRTLQLYRDNVGPNTTLVVGTDSDLFKYLTHANVLEN